MRLEVRENVPIWAQGLAPVLAIFISLVICSLLILWAGKPVLESYGLLIDGALGTSFALSETLTRATPLIFTGLAAAIAFKAKLWNIGGEGQLYMGAVLATVLGSGLITLHPVLMIPFLMVTGAVAAGLLLLIPTLLKNYLRVDEVVVTLLLNFIVLLFVNYLLEGPMQDPMSMGWPQGSPIIDEGVLMPIMDKARLHLGFILALIAAVGCWIFMKFSLWGYEIRSVGLNSEAARFSGININRTLVLTALISGGMAGIAGVSEVAGLKGYLTLDMSPGFGYAGIAVAMLAMLHPLGVIASAIFFAGIYVGADSMSQGMGIPSYIADVMVAVSILMILLSMLLVRYRVIRG
ncbi:ABC transporter permease [Amphritea sp. HPY]|uniref:ABC transporter permease n=1 Tax=Amphritea sp. HPY TaxID=3421652 RepID=UPI003D7C851C